MNDDESQSIKILKEFVHRLLIKIRDMSLQDIDNIEKYTKMLHSLACAEKLWRDGNEKEALMIYQRVKNELELDDPDFSKQNDEKLI